MAEWLPPPTALLLAPFAADRAVLARRHPPRDGKTFLLTHDLNRHSLALVVGPEDPHRMLGTPGLPPADRQDHVTTLHRQARVHRRLHDDDPPLRAEVFPQIRVDAHKPDIPPWRLQEVAEH